MTDHQRRALLARQGHGALEGRVDGLESAFIVEKHIPRQVPHARRLGGESSLGCGGGAAVDKEQPAFIQHLHDPIHGLAITGQAAAHMVVEPLDGHEAVEVGLQGLLQLGSLHADIQTTRPDRQRRAVFHGLVQNHRLASDSGLTGQGLGRLGVGQDCQGDGLGQRDDAPPAAQAVAQVIDDDTDGRSGCRVDQRRRKRQLRGRL